MVTRATDSVILTARQCLVQTSPQERQMQSDDVLPFLASRHVSFSKGGINPETQRGLRSAGYNLGSGDRWIDSIRHSTHTRYLHPDILANITPDEKRMLELWGLAPPQERSLTHDRPTWQPLTTRNPHNPILPTAPLPQYPSITGINATRVESGEISDWSTPREKPLAADSGFVFGRVNGVQTTMPVADGTLEQVGTLIKDATDSRASSKVRSRSGTLSRSRASSITPPLMKRSYARDGSSQIISGTSDGDLTSGTSPYTKPTTPPTPAAGYSNSQGDSKVPPPCAPSTTQTILQTTKDSTAATSVHAEQPPLDSSNWVPEEDQEQTPILGYSSPPRPIRPSSMRPGQ